MKKTKFNISGMTCSSCSAHVEKAVKAIDGVKNVNVNLLSNSMVVEYNESVVKDEKIIAVVDNAGYGASLFKDSKKELKEINNISENINFMKNKLIISICFLIPLMYISMGHMIGLPIPEFIHGSENALIFSFLQFLLLLPILYVNRNYFIVGFKRIFKGSPNMDSLIAIGSFAATFYGIIVIFIIGYGMGHGAQELVDKYSMDIYFESAGTILTLITFGKYLESRAKGKTNDAISKLVNLVPKVVTVVREGNEEILNLEEIILGDIIIVKPGGNIPVDGIIIEGDASIDQSAITGESIPVYKSKGDAVVSGTINKNGYLKMKATKVGEDTTLSQIIKLVETASNSKAPIAKIADKVSGIFVPIVIFISFIAFIIWLFVGESFTFALTMGISVLVISCPCALGLATPVAIMVGTGKGAENGILIKSAESLELLHQIDTIILDKTGTITKGKPIVCDIIGEEDLLKIAFSLERNSEHPLAEAVINKAIEEGIEALYVSDFISVSGRGISGKIDNVNYFGGNISFMIENKVDIGVVKNKSKELLEEGKTLLYFAKENKLIGIISVRDTIKDTSKDAVYEFKKRKLNTIMLTGDNKIVAEAIGKNIGIDKVFAEVLPQDKEKVVSDEQKLGRKVAFVGDGVNDSIALVKADVGIAIGSGTDIAIDSADIVLMKDSLADVVTAIDLSKAVIKNIKMNLFWAFFYNAVGIPVAAGVFFYSIGLKLNPMIAAAAMSLSSVCVVTNALRLRRFKPKGKKEENINNKRIVSIEGMQCNHCKMTVEKVLSNIYGVKGVEVDLSKKEATIFGSIEIDDDIIKRAIEEEGFKVNKII